MNHLQFITDTINKYPDRQVMFAEAIRVKASPHMLLFSCHGACVGPGGVYLLDDVGDWQGPLKEDQVNAQMLINSLYQRIKLMPPPLSVVVGQYDCDVNAVIFE